MAWPVLNAQIASGLKEVITSRSDRIVAIVGGAVVDEALYRMLLYRMRRDEGVNEFYFGPDGPLGSFGSRVNLAYLLQAIDKPTRDSLSAMAKIRNAFAHRLDITFRSNAPEIKKHLPRLILHEHFRFYPHGLWIGDSDERVRRPRTPRERFLANMRIILAILMRDLTVHYPHSNVPISAARVPSPDTSTPPSATRQRNSARNLRVQPPPRRSSRK